MRLLRARPARPRAARRRAGRSAPCSGAHRSAFLAVRPPGRPDRALGGSRSRSRWNSQASNTGPWRALDDVEFATLGYVDWFNYRRLHGGIIDGPRLTTPAAATQQPEPLPNRGRFSVPSVWLVVVCAYRASLSQARGALASPGQR
jgi:hypothetical protein